MTREDLTKIAALSDDELATMGVYKTADVEKHVQQANAADAKVEALTLTHAEALKAKDAAHADATKAAAEERLRAIQDAVDKVTAKANEQLTKLRDDANGKIAKLTEQLTAASLAIAELTAKNNADNDLANKLVQSYLGTDERRRRRLAEIEAEDAARAAERAELLKVGE